MRRAAVFASLLLLLGCGRPPGDEPVLETQEALDSAAAAAPPTLMEGTIQRAQQTVDDVNSRVRAVDSLLNL